jgi:glycerol uptake facilitator-like aquaporin
MVNAYVVSLSAFLTNLAGLTPPGLGMSVAAAFVQGGEYLASFRSEFVGTLLMVACTFSAGKWIGGESMRMAWTSHFLGVIAADFFGGGPHVNPAVTMSMWCLGKCSYTEAYVRVAGQLGGGLIAFPLFHAISDAMKLVPFGGPEFNVPDDMDHAVEAFLSESMATFSLMFVIYILNWELHFGANHYIIKQSLTAICIRALIEFFPTAGPAMNPMLATAWHVFGVGTTYEYPDDFQHYFVYWVGPFIAAIAASIVYVIYAGGTIFGMQLPIGPIKKPKVTTTKKKD